MRRVLSLAYYFPPVGGAGVQPSVKFLRYLPDLGYECAVITGPERRSLSWAPSDETLVGEIPPETRIYRLDGPEPPRSTGWRGRTERWMRLSSAFSRWWVNGVVSRGLDITPNVDLLYAPMAPWESGEAAAILAQKLEKPWVAHLYDPWALDDWAVYPTRVHRSRELVRMRRVLATASAIIVSVPEAARALEAHIPEVANRPVFFFSHGFDENDFVGPPPPRNDSAFRIVHAGYLHTQLGRRHRRTQFVHRLFGGSVRGLDILTRSHVFLLQAVDRIISARPELRSVIEVHLAGVLSTADHDVPAWDVVRPHGYLPHAESVALLRSADLLFLPMHDLPPGTRVRTVPGKTYEYLASGRPILAALPDGDARDLLARAGNAYLCRPASVDCIERAIMTQLERWRAGEDTPAPSPTLLRQFEYRALAQRLADAFEAAAGEPGVTRTRP